MLSIHLLTPYGSFPHAQGVQRIDFHAAVALAAAFNAPLRKLSRLLTGLPVFIGHPDDAAFAGKPGHTDAAVYGTIRALEAKPDGLYAQIKWSREGLRLVADETYRHLSPRWMAMEEESGLYRPVRLLSCGLTNTPNLPVPPLANSTGGGPLKVEDRQLVDELNGQMAHLLNGAIQEARIAPHERDGWARRLATDFDDTARVLANQQPLLSTRSHTRNLLERSKTAARGETFLDAVAKRSAETGECFEESWQALKRERPHFFS